MHIQSAPIQKAHVQAANVSMQAQHQLQRHNVTREIAKPQVKTKSIPKHPGFEKPGHEPRAVKSSRPNLANTIAPNKSASANLNLDNESLLDANVLIIKRILEAFLGKEICLSIAKEACSIVEDTQDIVNKNTEVQQEPEEQWVHLSMREQEVSTFAITAEITLANGETRVVSIEQKMARSLQLELDVTSQQAAKIIDPLVINFGGPVKLSSDRVEFDLNSDGEKDSIASFASNSAFLAYDRNGDGKINDGSELFGAATGNGFAELAIFDEDGNGFIDNQDSIFTKLRIFNPASNQLEYLRNTDIEALYLGNVTTPFILKEGADDLGYVRSSGFYLTETGSGTIQQIDLVV